MVTIEEYKALGVGSQCPQCLVVKASDPEIDDVGRLLIKHGKFGEFIACSNRCGYTRSIPGRSFYPAPENKGLCQTCQNTSYIPFVKPDGLVSKFAQVVCPECEGYNHERNYADANLPDRQPEDFDFACSEPWRGFYNRERSQQVSDKNGQLPDTIDNRRWDSVQQIRAQVNYLNAKVTELRAEKKKSQGEY